MKNKIVIKNIKSKFYHKLINNEAIYDKNSINRYKKKTGNNEKSLNKNKFENLQSLKNKINSIKNCELKKSATNLVFSDGNPDAKIMIIGEGPGANEDKEGKPFVGRAGKLLDKMLESIKLNRKNVYISNVVNFRPPMNRKPTDEEIQRYLPFLIKHIELINPKILLLLGTPALKTVLKERRPISKVRGTWYQMPVNYMDESLCVMPLFHPAYLLRYSNNKIGSPKWLMKQDMQRVKAALHDMSLSAVID